MSRSQLEPSHELWRFQCGGRGARTRNLTGLEFGSVSVAFLSLTYTMANTNMANYPPFNAAFALVRAAGSAPARGAGSRVQ